MHRYFYSPTTRDGNFLHGFCLDSGKSLNSSRIADCRPSTSTRKTPQDERDHKHRGAVPDLREADRAVQREGMGAMRAARYVQGCAVPAVQQERSPGQDLRLDEHLEQRQEVPE